ncbi:MAG: DNA starvation/stationary phase protection protein [Betaproteobacteria bacterium]|nr:MAG: DNA starvation/stationary phase protection protein [Betaproteobacteria bacterium]
MKPNIGISDKNRKVVTDLLADLLANEVALYVATRGAHWNVVGPNFGALHKFFEDQYEALDDILDDVAERMRALGATAPATVSAYARAKSIDDGAGSAKGANAMVASLLQAHETIIKQLRKAEDVADEAGDSGTEDFLTGLMEQHEKMAWMLRAHLQ